MKYFEVYFLFLFIIKASSLPVGEKPVVEENHIENEPSHPVRSTVQIDGHPQKRDVEEHHTKVEHLGQHDVSKRGEHIEHAVDKRSNEDDEDHAVMIDPMLGEGHVIERRSHDEHSVKRRSTGQGNEEEDAEAEAHIDSDPRRKRSTTETENFVDEPMPEFPSDGENSAHSVAVRLRVKRVSRAGSSHKPRTMQRNKGNSKVGESSD